MFIEKYQPYTHLAVTYDGDIIPENVPLTLPSLVLGEYKVNLDAIGISEDERENLPFTRNDITWWILDDTEGLLTKEINLDDEVGTKFTIDDSGTFSILSTYFEASEEMHLMIICVLGKPNSLNVSEFDNTIPNGFLPCVFENGGGGGGGSDTPKIPKSHIKVQYDQTVTPSTINSQSIDVYYSQVKTSGETPTDRIVPTKKVVGQTAISGTRVTLFQDVLAVGSMIIFANQTEPTSYTNLDINIDPSVQMTEPLMIQQYLGTVTDVVHTGMLYGFIVPEEVNNEEIIITIHTEDGNAD